MANDLLILDGKTATMPAHIAKRYAGRPSNIIETSVSQPSLRFIGKVWSIDTGSERIKIVTRNEEGDEVPVATIPVVILGYAQRRGRAYYANAYDAGNVSQPDCTSTDGITPDQWVDTPVSAKCAACPMSVKGSRVTDNNKQVTACSEHRILAVVPARKLDMTPLRLKIPVTSDYDGQSKDLQAKGQYAFSNYLGFLKARDIQFTDAIVTKLTFDPNVSYPKITFKVASWLDEAQCDAVEKLKAGNGIEAILGTTAEPKETTRYVPAQVINSDGAANGRLKIEEETKARIEAVTAAELKAKNDRRAANKARKEAEAAEIAAKVKAEAEAAAQAAHFGGGDDDEDEDFAPVVVPPAPSNKGGGAVAKVESAKVIESVPIPESMAELFSSWD